MYPYRLLLCFTAYFVSRFICAVILSLAGSFSRKYYGTNICFPGRCRSFGSFQEAFPGNITALNCVLLIGAVIPIFARDTARIFYGTQPRIHICAVIRVFPRKGIFGEHSKKAVCPKYNRADSLLPYSHSLAESSSFHSGITVTSQRNYRHFPAKYSLILSPWNIVTPSSIVSSSPVTRS